MVGHLFINGVIGDLSEFDEDLKGQPFVQLKDVMVQASGLLKKGATSILVHIDSPGGSVYEGTAIYDYLIGLKKDGILINTITNGDVGSIATKIFLAGTIRTIVGEHEFFIHNPFLEKVSGDSEELEYMSGELKTIEKDIAKFYATITGQSEQGIRSLMKSGTGIRGQQAVDLGFATEFQKEKSPLNVLAVVKSKKSTKKNKKMSEKVNNKTLKKLANKLITALKMEQEKAKNIDLSMTEGKILRVPDAESEEMMIGKSAMIVDAEGTETPAMEGDHTLADGRVVKIDAGGMVVSIEGEVTEEENEIEALKQKIKDLEEKLGEKDEIKTEDVEALVADMKKATKAAKKQKKRYSALEAELRAIKTEYKIPETKTFNKQQNPAKPGYAEIKEKMKQYNVAASGTNNRLKPVKNNK